MTQSIRLAELKVYGFNERWYKNGVEHGLHDNDMTALDLIRSVYQQVLYNDSMWHFLWEGDYTVIRCDHFYAKTVKQIFEKFDEFTVELAPTGYEENIEITKKYLRPFVYIFHGLSVLALQIDDEDFLETLERINHCYMNMVTRPEIADKFRIPDDKYGTSKGMGWEPIALMMVAHMRSYTVGWYNGLDHGRKQKRNAVS